MCTLLLPPGDNPIAVNKYINKFPKTAGLTYSVTPMPAFLALNVEDTE